MNDVGSRSPAGQPEASSIKPENVAEDIRREITSASQTPVPATTDQPTDSNSRQSSSRPTESLSAQELTDIAMADAAPYGTRSRNRAGNHRPNYAEDQDMEFEFAPPPAKPASAKNATVGDMKRNQQLASETKKTAADPSSVRVNGADQDERSPSASVKEAIPGTSSFPATAPKRRKAAGAANTAITASGAGNNVTPNTTTQPTAKRPATSIPLANMSRESNMMTFEKSKGFLKKGGLVADDGTVLHVDGKHGNCCCLDI